MYLLLNYLCIFIVFDNQWTACKCYLLQPGDVSTLQIIDHRLIDSFDPPQQTNRQRAHLMAFFWSFSANLPWKNIQLGNYFKDF